MKYYYLKGALIADLAEGLAIECKLEKVKVGKKQLKRLTADFIYLKPNKLLNSPHKKGV